jgi:hypothetical protein
MFVNDLSQFGLHIRVVAIEKAFFNWLTTSRTLLIFFVGFGVITIFRTSALNDAIMVNDFSALLIRAVLMLALVCTLANLKMACRALGWLFLFKLYRDRMSGE